MRKYSLASPTAKSCVDLRDYRTIIETAVHQVLPNATVTVEERHYCVTPDPSPSAARKIGRLICRSTLKEHCVQIPTLFTSTSSIEEVMTDETANQECVGGHF